MILRFLYKLFVMGLFFFPFYSCDTDIEPVDFVQSSIEEQNPDLYNKYLTNLRNYKSSPHKFSLAWINNVKISVNQSQHIMSLPDSVDYAVLSNPSLISQEMQAEMKEARDKKLIKSLYVVDYMSVKAAYEKHLKDGLDLEKEVFLSDSIDKAISYCNQFGFDGIIVSYQGTQSVNLSPEELEEATADENLILDKVRNWMSQNGNKETVFMGLPENLLDRDFLNNVRYVMLPSQNFTSKGDIEYLILQQSRFYPVDKMFILTNSPSLDSKDKETGYFLNGQLAIEGAADVVYSFNVEGKSLAGMGVLNVSNLYFNLNCTYSELRNAIGIMNPSYKN